jgi:hypothetical protein
MEIFPMSTVKNNGNEVAAGGNDCSFSEICDFLGIDADKFSVDVYCSFDRKYYS